jgi:ABC-2 type transport system ATP-binding protein
MTDPAIEATGSTGRFGDVTAVDELDLTVEAGEVFGLWGPILVHAHLGSSVYFESA